MKKCGRCKQVKNISEFGKSKHGKNCINGTCLSCCSEISRSKSKFRPELFEITEDGEVWKKINEVFDWVDDGFFVSNKGRFFRVPYLNPQGSKWGGEFCKISLRFGVPVVCVRSKNPKDMRSIKISAPIIYYKLFVNPDFEVVENQIPIYHFKDGNNMNILDGNCIVLYSLENNPSELLKVYRFVSEYFCKINGSDFRFIGNRELSSITEEEYFSMEKSYNLNQGLNFTKFPKSGGSFINTIRHCMRKLGKKELGIVQFLLHMGIDIDQEYSNNRYISNLGSICDSNIECFVRNVYEHLGLVSSNFVKKNFNEILGVHETEYNPIPDEYFYVDGNLYFSETFGFCDQYDNDEISKIYNKKALDKEVLYFKYGVRLINIRVHGKTYQDVLADMNQQLIMFGIISNDIQFNDIFYPKSYRYIMKEELIKFYNKEGKMFSPKTLKEKDPVLSNKLRKFCDMNDFTLTEYLAKEIFKNEDITIARGVFSVQTQMNHDEITSKVKSIVKENNIQTISQLADFDESMYWRLFRMCRTNRENVSDFFQREFNINRKVKKYTYDELYEMFSGCKNRWDCQKKNESQYRNAKKMGIIDILFPKVK